MTVETSTLALTTVEAKYLHAGAITVSGSITGVLTASAGLVYRLCHLPKGAKVTTAKIAGFHGTAGAGTVELGVTEDTDIFQTGSVFSAASVPTDINTTTGLGYATTTATHLIARISATSNTAVGGTFYFSVTYHMD